MIQSNELTKKYPPFSVAMCVYGKDNPNWFNTALESVVFQTVMPSEIVLIVDGPVPNDIQNVIDKYIDICEGKIDFRVVKLSVNEGHGNARRKSLEYCTYELVALMDADDICIKDRFEKQLDFIVNFPDVDIVGGNIAEFIDDPKNPVAYRNVPQRDEEIKNLMRKKAPFNQMTVLFKKSKVEQAGGYLDWFCDEDYYLWLRMLQTGAVMANIGSVLVNVRVGDEMYNRRGGVRYFKSEAMLQGYMLKNRIIGVPDYIINIAKRLVVQVILPNKIRGWVFQKFAREKS